jgi:hypothetical protein
VRLVLFVWLLAPALASASDEPLPAPPLPTAPTQPDARAAARLDREGKRLDRARHYHDAAETFRRAYETFPAPVFLLNVAHCLAAAGDAPGAIVHFEAYCEATGSRHDCARERARFDRLAATLARSHRRARVTSEPPAAAVFVDDGDGPVGTTPLTLWLPHGSRRMRLVAEGHVPSSWEDTVTPEADPSAAPLPIHGVLPAFGRLVLTGVGPDDRLELDGGARLVPAEGLPLPPGEYALRVRRADGSEWAESVAVLPGASVARAVPPPPPPPATATATAPAPSPAPSPATTPPALPPEGILSARPEPLPDEPPGFRYPWYAWVTTGVAVAGFATGGAFLGLAAESADAAEGVSLGSPTPDPDRWRAHRDDASERALVGYVGLGVGGAAAVATGLVLLLENLDAPGADAGAPAIVPLPAADGAGLAIRGCF